MLGKVIKFSLWLAFIIFILAKLFTAAEKSGGGNGIMLAAIIAFCGYYALKGFIFGAFVGWTVESVKNIVEEHDAEQNGQSR